MNREGGSNGVHRDISWTTLVNQYTDGDGLAKDAQRRPPIGGADSLSLMFRPLVDWVQDLRFPWRKPALLAVTLAALAIDLVNTWLPRQELYVPLSVFALLALLSGASQGRQGTRASPAVPDGIAAAGAATTPTAAMKEPAIDDALCACIDAQGLCTYVSPALVRWLARGQDNLEGQGLGLVFGPWNGEMMESELELALQGQPRFMRCSAWPLDPSMQTLQVCLVPEREALGAIAGCRLWAIDATRAQSEFDVVQGFERRLRAILD